MWCVTTGQAYVDISGSDRKGLISLERYASSKRENWQRQREADCWRIKVPQRIPESRCANLKWTNYIVYWRDDPNDGFCLRHIFLVFFENLRPISSIISWLIKFWFLLILPELLWLRFERYSGAESYLVGPGYSLSEWSHG